MTEKTTYVADWVVKMTEDLMGPAPFAVGDRVRTPDGRMVEITSGRYWGDWGISNFWHWREVLADGTLADTDESGYGWSVAK